MMNRRLMGLVVSVLLVASACGNEQLGRSVPACGDDISATMIIQIQSVPSAEYVPCVIELQLGWEYRDLVPKLGDSRFSIGSDRAGDKFLEVILTDACEVDPTLESIEILPGFTQYRDVTIVPTNVFVVIATGNDRDLTYAEQVGELLEDEDFGGRTVFVSFDPEDAALPDKIEEAHSAGRPLIAIEQQDALNEPPTVGLALPGEATLRRAVELDDLVSRLDEYLGKPSYKGSWVSVFEGGCITYLFDAEGPGVASLVQDVNESFGLFPAREIQQQLRDSGILG